MDLCRHLRWKGYFGRRWRSEAELEAALALSDAPFSCLRTCQAWGPDDDLAAPEICDRERSCFEPSARAPRRKIT